MYCHAGKLRAMLFFKIIKIYDFLIHFICSFSRGGIPSQCHYDYIFTRETTANQLRFLSAAGFAWRETTNENSSSVEGY